ncbi:uncharacterized protein MONBRDRAFT_23924 [Monosiga brevicollis MX1]|uniref:Uncharacterized protein n=1 Tax=Monosiga brevicollis TaxID=81824 RepID=A9UV87_MONBE|nr:uncharacterized protein MONBRDRAFT_23924 [Monosiga brevicollis MX1]EDQ90851.1 predicted protein [Monosiga brevicollis MX1]|eukprot:XP_001744148.1 hypothetical protein [Monosiga brevicollis MX1]
MWSPSESLVEQAGVGVYALAIVLALYYGHEAQARRRHAQLAPGVLRSAIWESTALYLLELLAAFTAGFSPLVAAVVLNQAEAWHVAFAACCPAAWLLHIYVLSNWPECLLTRGSARVDRLPALLRIINMLATCHAAMVFYQVLQQPDVFSYYEQLLKMTYAGGVSVLFLVAMAGRWLAPLRLFQFTADTRSVQATDEGSHGPASTQGLSLNEDPHDAELNNDDERAALLPARDAQEALRRLRDYPSCRHQGRSAESQSCKACQEGVR